MVPRRRPQHALSVRDRTLTLTIYSAVEDLDLETVVSLSVYVQNAEVAVFGIVCSDRDRDFVLDMIAHVPGVTLVKDHIQVVDPNEVTTDVLTA